MGSRARIVRPRAIATPDRRPLVRPPPIRLGLLEVDVVRQTVRLGTTTYQLRPSGLRVLCLLAANPGRVLTREEIQDALWPADRPPASNSVDRAVCDLRRCLHDDASEPRIVETVPGRGYRVVAGPA